MRGVEIKIVHLVEDLDVTFTSNLNFSQQCNKGKVGGIRWSRAWPRCSSLWHRPLSRWWEGAHYLGTQGQSYNRVTTVSLQRERGHNSLPDVAYLLTARWTGAWGYRKNSPYFSTLPDNRTRDLSVLSRVCYRCTTEQCNESVRKANSMMGLIKRNFSFKNKDVVQPLNNNFVRPHLE